MLVSDGPVGRGCHNLTQKVTSVAVARRVWSQPLAGEIGALAIRPVAGHTATMTECTDYFDSLIRRKRIAVWYRDIWLYPRICRNLRGRVLDVGCGIGDMVGYRAQTVGVDVNPKAVAYCRSRGLTVERMEPDRLPFPDAEFDGAVLDNVLEHLDKPEPLLADIHRVLKPGASFVAGVPGERGFASDPDHKRHYPETELIRCIGSAGFELAKVFHQPFRSRLLDRYLRYYAIYGVFRRR